MPENLTLERLAEWTGEPVERLREWRSLGLIGRSGPEPLGLEDLERVRLVQLCLRRGISAEAIARADREGGGLLDAYLQLLFPGGFQRRYSLAEAAEILGFDLGLLRRLSAALGFADQGAWMRQRDVEALRGLKPAIELFPEDALLQGVKVYADSLGRVADMESRLFHFYVHGNLKARGLTGEALTRASQALGDRATTIIEPALLYFHELGWERAQSEDLVMHMAEEAGLLPPSEVPGELTRAVAFIDLSSFTPLTEAMGDAEAANVLGRFSDIVRASAYRWEGRIVKQIGDAFMLVFPDARTAVAAASEIESRTASEPHFPAVRGGIHHGTVLYREGDYVGANVNIASRVAGEAERHQVLVTAAVRNEAAGLPGVEFVPVGKRRLKGLADELELFQAHSVAAAAAEKNIDPVCGMELAPAEVAVKLSVEGVERVFCSDKCLRKFVAAPEKYPA